MGGCGVKLELLELEIAGAKRSFYLRPGSSDAPVIGQIFVDGTYDLSKLARFDDLRRLLAAGRAAGRRPLIIDAGANIGASSLWFATQCADALVVALEPEPANFQLLVANTEDCPVIPVPAALASGTKRMRVVDAGEGNWGFRTEEAREGEAIEGDVECVGINELYAAHAAACFPFITKIDIEGGEADVFARNTEWIRQTPLLIVELHDWLLPGRGTSGPFLRAIAYENRDFVYVGENIFSIANDLTRIGAAWGADHSMVFGAGAGR